MSVRGDVNCTKCGASINRVLWNYGKNRAITAFFCDNTCKGAWQTEQREKLGFTKEWLVDQYITKGKGANEIAREIGRDPKRVWEWLRDYGIKTRPRGHDTSHLPKDGSPFRGKKHTLEFRKAMSEKCIKEGRVPYKPEIGSYMKGRRGANTTNWKGGITPDRQAVYSSPEWCEAVKYVWSRDKAICQRCGKNHNTEKNRGNFHIHHIVSFMVKELRTDPDNLVLLCKACHKWVHSKLNIKKEFIKTR